MYINFIREKYGSFHYGKSCFSVVEDSVFPQIGGTMVFSIISILFNFVGALTLLLFGMNMLSAGIQKGAGSSLQRLLGIVSGNRITAVLTGLFVTSLIQSSSAATVMVVSFVNAEILTLAQAIGIIFGANIGTTITAWIVSLLGFSFKITALAVPLFGIGFVVKFMKKWRIHDFGEMFMGFGLLFLGLGLLSGTLKLNQESVAFLQNFKTLGFGGLLVGVLVSACLTALIHSSSAMTAIIITMAFNGSLTWELSAALVLGSNIGTTIDAVLSSIGGSTNARRAAMVHVGFNIAGVFLAILFFRPLLSLVDLIIPGTPESDLPNHIAMLHTVFNVCATLVFLPFVKKIESLVTHFVKDNKTEEDEHYTLPFVISPFAQNQVEIYLVQVERELSKMASRVTLAIDDVCSALEKPNKENVDLMHERVVAQERFVDEMHVALTGFLIKCSAFGGSSSVESRVLSLIQVTDRIEQLCDEVTTVIHIMHKTVDKKHGESPEAYERLLPYMTQVRSFFDYVRQHKVTSFTNKEKIFTEQLETEIDSTQKALEKLARKRISEGNDVKSELKYVDIVRRIEKAGDCIYGIVRAV